MHIPLRRCKGLLVAAYLAFNINTCIKTIQEGVLQDEFSGFAAPSAMVCVMLLIGIALSYLLVQFLLFDSLCLAGRSRPLRSDFFELPAQIHVMVLLLMVAQMWFQLSTGSGIAGSAEKTDSPLRYLIYGIPIDMIALIYLAAADDRRLYKANIAVYLLSSLARGWSSGLLFLVCIAAIRSKGIRISMRMLLTVGLTVVVVAPLILVLRFVTRDSALQIADVDAVLDLVLDGQNLYLYILGFVSDRLQHFTSVAHLFESRDVIGAALDAGEIRPFFLNGPWPYSLASVFGHQLAPELNWWLTVQAFGLDEDAVGYAVHVGMIGWPVVAPSLLAVYVLYIGGLGWASIQLSRAIGSKAVLDLTWLLWFLFLMNGWYGAFFSYLLGLVFVRLSQMSVRSHPRRLFVPQN